jgi:hypothetical protein
MVSAPAHQWTMLKCTHAGWDELNRERDPPLRSASLSLENAVRDPETNLLRQHDHPQLDHPPRD